MKEGRREGGEEAGSMNVATLVKEEVLAGMLISSQGGGVKWGMGGRGGGEGREERFHACEGVGGCA